MRTFTLSDEDAALLVESMDSHAWNCHEQAGMIVRDGGSHKRHAKAVRRLADEIKAEPVKSRATAFTRAGYSFRPVVQHETGMIGWVVYRKGERGPYAERAFIDPCSDGVTHTVNMANVGNRTDARPSFREACDLVMARLPREG